MVGASLEERDGYWHKTEAYRRLDQSGKSAVSYFLGMAQAKVTCELLLGIPHLMHVDAALALLKVKTDVSRPDWVGISLRTMAYTTAVEAKGRSGPWDRIAVEKSKKQSELMPSVLGARSSLCVASLAYFGRGDRWEAYLEDPEWPYDEVQDVSVDELLDA